MILRDLDSRASLGTDIERSRYPEGPGDSCIVYPRRQAVRVVLGFLGNVVRMSAPAVDIIVEADTQEAAWAEFLRQVRQREDCAWLSFDVGPTRREEIEEGLDAPEDEEWSEMFGGVEA